MSATLLKWGKCCINLASHLILFFLFSLDLILMLHVFVADYYKTEPDFKFSFKLTICSEDNPEPVPKVFSVSNFFSVLKCFFFKYILFIQAI